MRIAIIDMGTNTFNLLIAEVVPPNSYKKVDSQKFPVNLGEGGILLHQLMPNAIVRGLNAIKACNEMILHYKCIKTIAIATSAIREAFNGKEFVSQVNALDIEVEVVSGDYEAELIYKGVKMSMDLGEEPMLTIDIGGGSVELIIGTNNEILWKKSYKIGVARLKSLSFLF